MQKIGFIAGVVSLLCYSAVSPRTLPLNEYNLKFYDNLRMVVTCTLMPILILSCVFDYRENDINSVIHSFFVSFCFGYPLTFVAEIAVTTMIRLALFSQLEHGIFALTPKIPMIVLPWVLRETKYRPKRITLIAADFAASVVASPVIEEVVKLLLLQLTVKLAK
jgi:hypothetical protein